MASKRDVAWQFKRHELQELVRQYDVGVRGDARVLEDLVDAVVAKRRLPLREMLAPLSRDRLKEICDALELDTRGREKSALIDRIVGEERDGDADDEEVDTGKEADEDETDAPIEENADVQLRRLLGENFIYQRSNSGWPMLGTLVIDELRLDVAAYVRLVTGSSRDEMERRIQNPSTGRALLSIPGRHSLLLGVWRKQPEDDAVLCAFDAAVRVERTTRYSCFLPLSLLEQAADTGFATHVNTKNERIYAFRPDNIARYIQILLDKGELREEHLASATAASGIAISRTKTTPDAIDPTSADQLYIRPRVGMYAAFARLNYKPWFAIAEFVDNSIQSFLHQREALRANGVEGPLVIDIEIDHSEIRVTDRAGGIAFKDFPRAFSPAAPPDDPTGLSEFGLGMKAAACWFARRWSVRTSALGDPAEREVFFDIPTITRDGVERLPITTRAASESLHFTVVSMKDLRVPLRGRTLTKIRDHLSSIYRVLMKDDVMRIRLTTAGTSEDLSYEAPELLVAPFFREPAWPAVRWHREFKVELGAKRVSGWAGIMKQGSRSKAGFSVFRRRRLIEGSVGETYKPHTIFGAPNSFESLRIVGELFVDGFDVSHTKDGIQWGNDEDEILEEIRSQINSAGQPLIDQAKGYRSRKTADQLAPDFGVEALEGAILGLQTPATAEAVQQPAFSVVEEPVPAIALPVTPMTVLQARDMQLQVTRHSKPWTVHLELVRDPIADFYTVEAAHHDGTEVVRVRINLDHEFSVAWLNENEEAMQPMVRFVAAMAIGERVARLSGISGVSTVRRTANEILAGIVREAKES